MITTTKRPTVGGKLACFYSVQRFESVRLRRLRCAGLRRHGNPPSWRNIHGYEFTGCASHFLTLSPVTRALIERDIVADIRERPHEWEHPEVAEVVEARPATHNLVLDQGLNNWFTGRYLLGDFNRYCAIGTGTTPPAVSDVGIQANPVGGERRTGTMLTGSGNCGSTLNTTAGTLALKRTHDFPVQVANENFTELIWSHSASAGNNANSRVLISGGTVTALIGQQLRVVHESTLTCSPTARQSGTIGIGGTPGWPHPSGSATSTDGEWQWGALGFSNVSNYGSSDSSYSYPILEPAYSQRFMAVWYTGMTLQSFGTAATSSGEFLTTYPDVFTPIGTGSWQAYTPGSFTRTVSFASGAAVPPAAWSSVNGIRGFQIGTYYLDPTVSRRLPGVLCVRFNELQTKTNLDALRAPGFTLTLSR